MRLTVASIIPHLGAMNLADLQELNRHAVRHIRAHHDRVDRAAASRFEVGDLVEFVDEKRARKVRMRVSSVNAKSLSGNELDGLRTHLRVSPKLCRLVGG